MVGLALSCSLYGMFYDVDTGLVMVNYAPGFTVTPSLHRRYTRSTVTHTDQVNYVPGYGYAWMICWMIIMMVLFIALAVKQSKPLLLAAVVTSFYWLFWLFIPLLGYAWFFAWRFVDGVVEQARGCHTGCHTDGCTGFHTGCPMACHTDGCTGHGLSHGLSHGWLHGLSHGLSHGLF